MCVRDGRGSVAVPLVDLSEHDQGRVPPPPRPPREGRGVRPITRPVPRWHRTTELAGWAPAPSGSAGAPWLPRACGACDQLRGRSPRVVEVGCACSAASSLGRSTGGHEAGAAWRVAFPSRVAPSDGARSRGPGPDAGARERRSEEWGPGPCQPRPRVRRAEAWRRSVLVCPTPQANRVGASIRPFSSGAGPLGPRLQRRASWPGDP